MIVISAASQLRIFYIAVSIYDYLQDAQFLTTSRFSKSSNQRKM